MITPSDFCPEKRRGGDSLEPSLVATAHMDEMPTQSKATCPTKPCRALRSFTRSMGRSRKTGFTLIELIIAITIVAILALVVAPKFMGYLDNARIAATTSNLKNIKTAIDGFRIQTGKYPTKLRDLVEKPKEEAAARNWQKGGYLEGTELPKDSWDEDFVYKRTPEGKNPYELYSYGPEGAGAPKETWISVWKE